MSIQVHPEWTIVFHVGKLDSVWQCYLINYPPFYMLIHFAALYLLLYIHVPVFTIPSLNKCVMQLPHLYNHSFIA